MFALIANIYRSITQSSANIREPTENVRADMVEMEYDSDTIVVAQRRFIPKALPEGPKPKPKRTIKARVRRAVLTQDVKPKQRCGRTSAPALPPLICARRCADSVALYQQHTNTHMDATVMGSSI